MGEQVFTYYGMKYPPELEVLTELDRFRQDKYVIRGPHDAKMYAWALDEASAKRIVKALNYREPKNVTTLLRAMLTKLLEVMNTRRTKEI